MLTKFLLFSLLPAAIYCGIRVKIIPAKTLADSDLRYGGKEVRTLTDKDRKLFGLESEKLKKLISEHYKISQRCEGVYLNAPTPFGDVYSEYGWTEVKQTTKVVDSFLYGVRSKPVAVASSEYVNSHGSISATYSTTLSQEVEDTISHTWSKGGELGVGQEINYEVNFGAGSVGGTTSLSYTSSWGEESTESRTVRLGTSSSVLVTVPPGEIVIAELTATKGSVKVEMVYGSMLNNGKVFCHYKDKQDGHYFWAYTISEFLPKWPLSVNKTEDVSVGFFTSSRIEIHNGTNDKLLEEKKAEVLSVGKQTKVVN